MLPPAWLLSEKRRANGQKHSLQKTRAVCQRGSRNQFEPSAASYILESEAARRPLLPSTSSMLTSSSSLASRPGAWPSAPSPSGATVGAPSSAPSANPTAAAISAPCLSRSEEHTSELQSRENL